MQCTDYLTILNILVALLGAALVVLTIFEYSSLRKIKTEFTVLKKELTDHHYRNQQAAHRIISSYGMKDPRQRIECINQALHYDNSVFNGYNSLGYAWLELNEPLRAADAFKEAVTLHPNDKAGYCDLAYAYLTMNNPELCRQYLEKAVQIDPSSAADIKADPRFSSI